MKERAWTAHRVERVSGPVYPQPECWDVGKVWEVWKWERGKEFVPIVEFQLLGRGKRNGVNRGVCGDISVFQTSTSTLLAPTGTNWDQLARVLTDEHVLGSLSSSSSSSSSLNGNRMVVW